ncbi:hypothetical protein GGR49_003744 [Sphingomonas carotinifaciens]|nr:hypothetical protein [Sphingomonas carotinifaciens]
MQSARQPRRPPHFVVTFRHDMPFRRSGRSETLLTCSFMWVRLTWRVKPLRHDCQIFCAR